MAKKGKAKKLVKKKVKTKNVQQIEECVSSLRQLHMLQGVLLGELDKCVSKKSMKG